MQARDELGVPSSSPCILLLVLGNQECTHTHTPALFGVEFFFHLKARRVCAQVRRSKPQPSCTTRGFSVIVVVGVSIRVRRSKPHPLEYCSVKRSAGRGRVRRIKRSPLHTALEKQTQLHTMVPRDLPNPSPRGPKLPNGPRALLLGHFSVQYPSSGCMMQTKRPRRLNECSTMNSSCYMSGDAFDNVVPKRLASNGSQWPSRTLSEFLPKHTAPHPLSKESLVRHVNAGT